MNLVKLEEEFLMRYPDLVLLSKRYSISRTIAGTTIIGSVFIHMINVSFFESLNLFIVMILVPSLIMVILNLSKGKDFHSIYNLAIVEYLPLIVESIEGASLKYIGYEFEMNNSEVRELGFLQEEIHPLFKPTRRHYLKGTYKNVNIEICELDFKHNESKTKGLNYGWKPSTLIVFDHPSESKEVLSFYPRRSRHYRSINDRRSIFHLSRMIKIDLKKIKTKRNILNHKYLVVTTCKNSSTEILSDNLLNQLISFSRMDFRKMDQKIRYDANFFTLYKGKIVIVLFNQKLFDVRIKDIFEVYKGEIESSLQLVDKFINSK